MTSTLVKQNRLIDNEKKSIKTAFKNIPDEKQSIANKLIDRLAFMTITQCLIDLVVSMIN